MFGPAREFCRDVIEELHRAPADAVGRRYLDPVGAVGGGGGRSPFGPADARALPAAAAWRASDRDGVLPARGAPGRLRDRALGAVLLRVFGTAMPALNQARTELGLAPLDGPLDLAAAATRILVCTSPSFDFAADAVPGNTRYVGPQLDDSAGAARGDQGPASRPQRGAGQPQQHGDRQEVLLQRAAEALGRLQVRGLVTTGPAVNPAVIPLRRT